MLNHLLDEVPLHLPNARPEELVPIEKTSPQDLLGAQLATAGWLDDMDAPPESAMGVNSAQHVAREAFGEFAAGVDVDDMKVKLMSLETPVAVRHLVATLTAYDWAFVEQAKELRGYAVAQIVEHTKHPDAKIRLKALDMLGKVTEVALFTERVEVKKVDMSDAELDSRLKERMERLSRFIGASVSDVVPHELPAQPAPVLETTQSESVA